MKTALLPMLALFSTLTAQAGYDRLYSCRGLDLNDNAFRLHFLKNFEKDRVKATLLTGLSSRNTLATFTDLAWDFSDAHQLTVFASKVPTQNRSLSVEIRHRELKDFNFVEGVVGQVHLTYTLKPYKGEAKDYLLEAELVCVPGPWPR